MTPILRAAIISLCALEARPAGFHSPNSFAKLPPEDLLDFPCATPATQIALDRLFFSVRSVGRMACPPYCPLVLSPAGFIRLILLRSLVLDFPCATPATPIAPDRLFLSVRSVGRMARRPHVGCIEQASLHRTPRKVRKRTFPQGIPV